MKKLMTMSFVILFSVLSILSCINFSYNALESIENDKQTITIEKPEDITNEKFLEDIDKALGKDNADIMYRMSMSLARNRIIFTLKQIIPIILYMVTA